MHLNVGPPPPARLQRDCAYQNAHLDYHICQFFANAKEPVSHSMSIAKSPYWQMPAAPPS